MRSVRRALAAVLTVLASASGGLALAQSPPQPDDAVFQIVTMTPDGASFRSVALGTAFFVDADGTALTNSHVVYLARQNPARYKLLAIVGREFYAATLVCAAPLSYDPAKESVVIGRDVAEIKLSPAQFSFDQISYAKGGPRYAAHVSRLPAFPALKLGDDPPPGAAVRIIGYGNLTVLGGIVPGLRWTASGTVDLIDKAPDGTTVFRVGSKNRPKVGNSGSPVLDDAGRVVGIWTWNEPDNEDYGAAIASSALRLPCRARPLTPPTPR